MPLRVSHSGGSGGVPHKPGPRAGRHKTSIGRLRDESGVASEPSSRRGSTLSTDSASAEGKFQPLNFSVVAGSRRMSLKESYKA